MDSLKKITIAAFDFDGTITKKDTFLDFIRKNCGWKRSFFVIAKNVPVLLPKEKIFSDLFKGVSIDEFNRICRNYSFITNNEALKKIEWHKGRGHKLVIVSASIENWIAPWALKNGFEKVIATVPEVQNGILTGRFKTKNCNKGEKAVRFLKEYPDRESYYMYAYGDSYKDRQLFNIADEAFYRKFL